MSKARRRLTWARAAAAQATAYSLWPRQGVFRLIKRIPVRQIVVMGLFPRG